MFGPTRSATRRKHARVVVTIAVMALVGAACGDDGRDATAASTDSLKGTSWTLASAAVAGRQVPAVGSAALTFETDGKSMSGSTGCNQFSGTYLQSGSNLTIKLGPMTRAACADQAATTQETAIVAGLANVASFSIGSPKLVLKDNSGQTLLTYQPAVASLAGTSWTGSGVNNGNGGVEASALTETITAKFATDGTLSGFAGCNDYHATYEVSGTDKLSVSAISSTQKACPDDATTLESNYLAALKQVATYGIKGDILTLRDAGGSTQVTYRLVG